MFRSAQRSCFGLWHETAENRVQYLSADLEMQRLRPHCSKSSAAWRKTRLWPEILQHLQEVCEFYRSQVLHSANQQGKAVKEQRIHLFRFGDFPGYRSWRKPVRISD